MLKIRMAMRSDAEDNAWQMAVTPTLEDFTALQQALAEALKRNESLAGELRVTRTERDLLKEQLNKFQWQLFAASSEVTGQHQKDMFFNEARASGRRPHRRSKKPTTTRSTCRATSAPSAGAGRWILRCRARWCGTNCPKASACAPTTARPCASSA